MNLTQRIRLAFRVLTYRTGNLMAHAESELGPGMDIELRELLLVFSSQGHSGASAAITADLVGRLLRYEPIGPLTGNPDEWVEVGDGMYQNRRCAHVFKQADRFNGQAYDLDGIVWEEPDGVRFTNAESMVPVVFPYTPRTEYRPCPA
jgi:hypothetical protein